MPADTFAGMPHLSIVIPTFNQPAELWFTLQCALQQLKLLEEKYTNDWWEIVVADNVRGGDKLTKKIVGDLHDKRVRYLNSSAVQSPYHPRNDGAAAAKGEWLLFLDSHVLMSPSFFERVAQSTHPHTRERFRYPDNAIVHYPVIFGNRTRKWGHYKLKLDTDFWGSWGPKAPTDRAISEIGATGIWAMCMRRSWYLDELKGFNPLFKGYSGGEPYLDLKSWCLGGSVLIDAGVYGAHYSGPRSYGAQWRDRIRNFALAIEVLDPSRFPTFEAHYVAKTKNPGMVASAIVEGRKLAAAEAADFGARRRYKVSEVLELFKSRGVPH